jgi:hypothetical protein
VVTILPNITRVSVLAERAFDVHARKFFRVHTTVWLAGDYRSLDRPLQIAISIRGFLTRRHDRVDCSSGGLTDQQISRLSPICPSPGPGCPVVAAASSTLTKDILVLSFCPSSTKVTLSIFGCP